MDLKNWKKALGIGLVSAAAISSPAANAAQVTMTIDVDLPTILVMYHYNTITLALDQTALGNYLTTGVALACGADFCDDQGSPPAIAVSTISANESVTQAVVDPGLANNSTQLTVVEDFYVHSTKHFDVAYDLIAADPVSAVFDVTIAGI